MPRIKRWKIVKKEHSIGTMQLSSWKYFYNFITQRMLDYSHFVWRGDCCDNHELLSSFDLKYIGRSQSYIEKKAKYHLNDFKEAVRGRRGINPAKLEEENDWWALGQHFGLRTPLLDWTHSAFVALFFAFAKVKKSQTKNRIVYAINPLGCEHFTDKIKRTHTVAGIRADYVEFFTPLQDENSRLVNQNSLFSRCTAGKSMEKWISERYERDHEVLHLIKILIPDNGRQECLRTLNKMNINYLTLFPDLYGSSSHVNLINSINKY